VKFENLSATMQNAILNGGKLIVHGDGPFNAHLSSAEKRWSNANHLLCHSCDSIAAEGEYDIIPVSVPPAFEGTLNTNLRIQVAKAVAKQAHLEEVRNGRTGSPVLMVLYALETGRYGDQITAEDQEWRVFLGKHNEEAQQILKGFEKNAYNNTDNGI